MGEKYKFQVNLGGMIELLSDHLYSSPNVYIRELLQNGIDAITGRELIDDEYKNNKSGVLKLTLVEKKSLVFTDNGVGLTEDEIHKFLSVIGESSKRDIETGRILEEYIGRFGIGILSCFMVSDKITIKTKSAKSEQAYIWVGKPDGTYTVKELDEDIPVGTQVHLRCKKGCAEYFSKKKVKELISYYGLILSYPIMFLCDGKEEQLNSAILPWEQTITSSEEILEFGEDLFGIEFLDCVLIKSDEGNISGVAYILPYSVSATTKQKHRLFLKNMLLTETSGELIPEWAVFTKCILNVRDLRPTASRESFYEDDMLKAARESISQSLFQYIKDIAAEGGVLLQQFMSLHQFAVKSIACENEELYKEFVEHFTFHTTFGELTGKAIINAENVMYCSHEKYRQISQLFTAQQILLVDAGYVFDRTLLTMMTDYFDVTVLPVIDDEIGNIFCEVSLQEQEMAAALIKLANEELKEYGCNVEVRRFKPDSVSCFYTQNEEEEIYAHLSDMQDSNEYSLFDDMFSEFREEFKDGAAATLFLNTDNAIIQRLMLLMDAGPSPENVKRIKQVLCVLYVQTLLVGNFPMSHNELNLMNDSMLGIIGDTLL